MLLSLCSHLCPEVEALCREHRKTSYHPVAKCQSLIRVTASIMSALEDHEFTYSVFDIDKMRLHFFNFIYNETNESTNDAGNQPTNSLRVKW